MPEAVPRNWAPPSKRRRPRSSQAPTQTRQEVQTQNGLRYRHSVLAVRGAATGFTPGSDGTLVHACGGAENGNGGQCAIADDDGFAKSLSGQDWRRGGGRIGRLASRRR